jgi:hypothetical protein
MRFCKNDITNVFFNDAFVEAGSVEMDWFFFSLKN